MVKEIKGIKGIIIINKDKDNNKDRNKELLLKNY